jgi:hypothetical protein
MTTVLDKINNREYESKLHHSDPNYRKDLADLQVKFRDDLLKEHGYDPDDEVGSVLYNAAWQRGHSAGLHEIAVEFMDLVELSIAIENATHRALIRAR